MDHESCVCVQEAGGKTPLARRQRPGETARESQTRLTERREIKERTLRHQVQAQTSDRDNIKGGIFRSHDTLWRINEQKGKESEGEKKRINERVQGVMSGTKNRSIHLPGSEVSRASEALDSLTSLKHLCSVYMSTTSPGCHPSYCYTNVSLSLNL